MARTINPGTYGARAIDKTPTPTKEGGLAMWFQVELIEFPTIKLQTWQTLVAKDGTVLGKNIENLKSIFGWDGIDPLWFEVTDLAYIEFDVVIEDAADLKDPSKIYSKIKWMNPKGGGPTTERPKTIDKSTLAAKFGSKLRAMAGPQKPTAPPRPAAPTAHVAHTPPPPPAPPVATGKTSTLDAAWGELCGTMAGEPDDKIKEVWFQRIGELFPGKGNNLTPEEWEAVRDSFTDNVPY